MIDKLIDRLGYIPDDMLDEYLKDKILVKPVTLPEVQTEVISDYEYRALKEKQNRSDKNNRVRRELKL